MGFATRFTFEEFVDRYSCIVSSTNLSIKKKDLQSDCNVIINKCNNVIPIGLVQLGKSKVFLKTEAVSIHSFNYERIEKILRILHKMKYS